MLRTRLQIQIQTQLNSASWSCNDTCDQTDRLNEVTGALRGYASSLKNRPIFFVLTCCLSLRCTVPNTYIYIYISQLTCLAILLTRCSPCTETSDRLASTSAYCCTVLCSDLSPMTGYSSRGFSWLSSVSPHTQCGLHVTLSVNIGKLV